MTDYNFATHPHLNTVYSYPVKFDTENSGIFGRHVTREFENANLISNTVNQNLITIAYFDKNYKIIVEIFNKDVINGQFVLKLILKYDITKQIRKKFNIPPFTQENVNKYIFLSKDKTISYKLNQNNTQIFYIYTRFTDSPNYYHLIIQYHSDVLPLGYLITPDKPDHMVEYDLWCHYEYSAKIEKEFNYVITPCRVYGKYIYNFVRLFNTQDHTIPFTYKIIQFAYKNDYNFNFQNSFIKKKSIKTVMFEYKDYNRIESLYLYKEVYDNIYVIKNYLYNHDIININFNMETQIGTCYNESKCFELDKPEFVVMRNMLINNILNIQCHINYQLFKYYFQYWKYTCLNLHEYIVIVYDTINNKGYIFYVNMQNNTINEVKIYDSMNQCYTDPMSIFSVTNKGCLCTHIYTISDSFIDIFNECLENGETIQQSLATGYNSNIYYFNRSSHTLHKIIDRPNIPIIRGPNNKKITIIKNQFIDIGNGQYLGPSNSCIISANSCVTKIQDHCIAILEQYLPLDLCEIIFKYIYQLVDNC